MVFITAGEGGGTGTGGAPVVAEVARNLGTLTIGVVTRPFGFEGRVRAMQAETGIQQLREKVDALIVIPNDRLLTQSNDKTSMINAFKMADEILLQGVQGITDLLTTPGVINTDFADVKKIMANAGTAVMGIGYASGDGRAVEAARKAITSPLLEATIDGARGILLNIAGGPDLGLFEVNEAANIIQEIAHPDVNLIFGNVIDEAMGDEVRITVIATGFDRWDESKAAGGRWTRDLGLPAAISARRGSRGMTMISTSLRSSSSTRASTGPAEVRWTGRRDGSGSPPDPASRPVAMVSTRGPGRGSARSTAPSCGWFPSPAGAQGVTGDALVTAAPGVALAVFTADCAPVALVSPEGVVGIVHAGWRGLEAGVVDNAVETMRRMGATRIDAALGPCIRPGCYEFGEAELERLAARLGPSVRARTSTGRPALDLPAAVSAALERAGAALVSDRGDCTACSDEWFSHRARREEQRQATVIVGRR